MSDAGSGWSIGRVAELSGTPATTLRYYEQRGLIDPPPRVGGKRRYDPGILMRLMLIDLCRVAGLTLDEIGEVIGDPAPGRLRTKEIADRRIEAIEGQIAGLELARDLLAAARGCRCVHLEACACGALAPLVERLRAARPPVEVAPGDNGPPKGVEA